MPSGDAQRVWFPELIHMLRDRWQPDLSWSAWIELRDQLDAELQLLRAQRGIQPPLMRCPKCGVHGRQAQPRVSVRAAILALGRFGVADEVLVKDIDRRWNQHRRRESLDLYGKPATERIPRPCHDS